LLTCHIWGFYPAEVTVIWLHNGDIVGPGDPPPISATPNGNWTYQTQVTLMVAPVAGDTFTCSVQHGSRRGGQGQWLGGGHMGTVAWGDTDPSHLLYPPLAGYTPLPGHNYPAGNG
uniref:Ig-like domain-containing protein n=1 Tax=Falco tinnunculus TaxID=100819 RepID=A0A8C4UT73_FALTI